MKARHVNHKRGVGCEENYPGSDYTDDEREFLVAMDCYKRHARRPFPTWREAFHVFLRLGYRKQAPPKP